MPLNEDDKCICPHCKYEFEDPIQDFAICGRVGPASEAETECDECRSTFSVVKNHDGTFTVSI